MLLILTCPIGYINLTARSHKHTSIHACTSTRGTMLRERHANWPLCASNVLATKRIRGHFAKAADPLSLAGTNVVLERQGAKVLCRGGGQGARVLFRGCHV